ncbi:unnamed protein product [Pleuronectes platessa]|uniref:HpcH/HpaI aldolase/citrate lyase domain-containing protein n=1 Tax=Pleuronectes platessa TaxID=8262 RepID=A0A9N7W0N2_PLEPL|nr:unnamed protein product [Pleuronectes platessa]
MCSSCPAEPAPFPRGGQSHDSPYNGRTTHTTNQLLAPLARHRSNMAAHLSRAVKRLLPRERGWLLPAGWQFYPESWRHQHHSAGSSLRYIPRRAVLYCPGNDERKLRKLASLDVDCVVLDCEDGVALSKKAKNCDPVMELVEVRASVFIAFLEGECGEECSTEAAIQAPGEFRR